jgi:hypothetical protein
MTRFFLAAGVAALAISAPAASKPGGNGGGHGHAAAQQDGGHGGKAKAEARGGDRKQAAQATVKDRGHQRVAVRSEARVKARAEARAENRHANKIERVREARHDRIERVRQAEKREARQIREARNDRIERVRDLRNDRIREIREARNDQIQRVRDLRNRDVVRFADRDVVGFGVGGCPPGLAKKPVRCMPPGQAKKLVGARVADIRRIAAFNDVPLRLRSIYADTPDYYYRYGDGYMYRVNRTNDVVSALLPLFGLGYTAGQPWPVGYNSYNYGLPMAYQPFYPQTPYADYRYANGYVYEVDPFTGLIRDVDPMLGYGYGYGQMMPMTYSAYNVPYQYRPYYYDTSGAYYRYAPGAIYQVDPTTSLITAVAALLSPNSLAVGQPLPMGYSAYNIPYDYRARYYDTPNDWYRYSNGNIYRVDPATQLVTALVVSALT